MRKQQKEKWFTPSPVSSGWHKNLSMKERRRRALKAHGDNLSAARSLQALANVTKDKTTKRLARSDALYFYKQHEKEKK